MVRDVGLVMAAFAIGCTSAGIASRTWGECPTASLFLFGVSAVCGLALTVL